MSISLIVATDRNGVIGDNDSIPWIGEMPDDLKFFQSKTAGRTVVVGRKTWESLPPLRNRKFIIVSRESSTIFFSFEDALEMVKDEKEEVFIIGGAEIYKEFMPYANKIYLTRIEEDFRGDAFFPKPPKEWQIVYAKKVKADDRNKFDSTYMVYKRMI